MDSEKQSGQYVGGFGHARGPALEPDILNFETLRHKFVSISSIYPNIRTIHSVVTEENKWKKRKKNKKKKQPTWNRNPV